MHEFCVNDNLIVVILAAMMCGVVVYVVMLLVLKTFSKKEIEMAKSVISNIKIYGE